LLPRFVIASEAKQSTVPPSRHIRKTGDLVGLDCFASLAMTIPGD
jgi:hypothetical protein